MNKKLYKIVATVLTIITIAESYIVFATSNMYANSSSLNINMPSIYYSTHVQDIGWQGLQSNGSMAGTEHQGKRLEALTIKLNGIQGGVVYKTHIQDIGWQGSRYNGNVSGTEGQCKRLEALTIALTGDAATKYDIYYKVHIQDYGWSDWSKNGQMAGTEHQCKRLEALEIKLEPKGNTESLENSTFVKYRTHIQDIGWQNMCYNGQTAGTTGLSKRMECISIEVGGNSQYSGGVKYSAHVEDIGWQRYMENGEGAGTVGQGKRVEAIKIALTGQLANKYTIKYRGYIEGIGWSSWKMNGNIVGTTGSRKRLEAIEIKLEEKAPVVVVQDPAEVTAIKNFYKNHDLGLNSLTQYDITPNTNSFDLGRLNSTSMYQSLNTFNYIRLIAGLNSNSILKNDFSESAQYASMISAANGYVSHEPPQPAGMSDDMYFSASICSQMCDMSSGFRNIPTSLINGYLYDSDESNVSSLCHRRDLLSPSITKVGFGEVDKNNVAYTSAYMLDSTGLPEDNDPVMWPAKYMPSNLMPNDLAWSVIIPVSLTSDWDNYFKINTTNNVRVQMTRQSDGATWNFDSSCTNQYGNYLNIYKDSRSINIIFRPLGAQYQVGDVYDVTVTGLIDKNNNPTQINYSTTIFNQ